MFLSNLILCHKGAYNCYFPIVNYLICQEEPHTSVDLAAVRSSQQSMVTQIQGRFITYCPSSFISLGNYRRGEKKLTKLQTTV